MGSPSFADIPTGGWEGPSAGSGATEWVVSERAHRVDLTQGRLTCADARSLGFAFGQDHVLTAAHKPVAAARASDHFVAWLRDTAKVRLSKKEAQQIRRAAKKLLESLEPQVCERELATLQRVLTRGGRHANEEVQRLSDDGQMLFELLQRFLGGWDPHSLIRSPDESDALLRTLSGADARVSTGALVEVQVGNAQRKVAVIRVPAFYGRGVAGQLESSGEVHSSTADLRAALRQAKQQGASAVVLDLRHNPGGELGEAIDATGLFLGDAAIVGALDASRNLTPMQDSDPGIVYAGPVVVLVDGQSASGAEIFAGALQDYGRAIVLGETTYGKGTVQQVRALAGGQILYTFTVAVYFLPSGRTPQLYGIQPDIWSTHPAVEGNKPFGEAAVTERDLPYPIAVADHVPSFLSPPESVNPGASHSGSDQKAWIPIDLTAFSDLSNQLHDPARAQLTNGQAPAVAGLEPQVKEAARLAALLAARLNR